MGDSQISLGRGNRRAFMSGLRVGGNGNKKDQVGEGTETGEGERVCCRRVLELWHRGILQESIWRTPA